MYNHLKFKYQASLMTKNHDLFTFTVTVKYNIYICSVDTLEDQYHTCICHSD